MGGMVELNQPQQRCCFGFCPCCCLSFAHHPEIVIFDRSCSQPHREQRSREIRFSTSTFPQPPRRICVCLADRPLPSTKKTNHSERSEETGISPLFQRSQLFFRVFAQKSHVKPQKHLNASNKRK
jgi:hypothetical protein